MRIGSTTYSISGRTNISLTSGTTYTFTVLTVPTGYNFVGWWEEEDLSDDANSFYDYYLRSTSTSCSMTAKWGYIDYFPVFEPAGATYTITANGNGGRVGNADDEWLHSRDYTTATRRVFVGDTYAALPEGGNRSGYIFTGWYT